MNISSYDALKLLEAHCVHRWLVLSSRSSYDKLSGDRFLEHLQSTRTKFNDNMSRFLKELENRINLINNPSNVGIVFGSFRLWNHPFINYIKGLKALKKLCRLPKIIDKSYTESLSDDLARMVIHDYYKITGN